ncbi:hypothetical protein JMJ35_006203 [Cladonia borealis]|uniref:Uncharacterized protein n=1 Tax=Cladonia borealis TaxID=184061 RepID=A0AA39QYR5_9LECA|nr:hypothetical protein JMJ35_006203 [Cladonia borealis]
MLASSDPSHTCTALSCFFLACSNADAVGIMQTPLEKAHVVRAEKKKRREEIKAKRLAVLKEAREKKARAKKA